MYKSADHYARLFHSSSQYEHYAAFSTGGLIIRYFVTLGPSIYRQPSHGLLYILAFSRLYTLHVGL